MTAPWRQGTAGRFRFHCLTCDFHSQFPAAGADRRLVGATTKGQDDPWRGTENNDASSMDLHGTGSKQIRSGQQRAASTSCSLLRASSVAALRRRRVPHTSSSSDRTSVPRFPSCGQSQTRACPTHADGEQTLSASPNNASLLSIPSSNPKMVTLQPSEVVIKLRGLHLTGEASIGLLATCLVESNTPA